MLIIHKLNNINILFFLITLRSICFKRKSNDSTSSNKIVAEEIIEEIKDDTLLTPTPAKQSKTACVNINKPSIGVEKKNLASHSLVKRKQPLVLVKTKTVQNTPTLKDTATSAGNETKKITSTNENGNTVGSLSMLAAYSNSSEESE